VLRALALALAIVGCAPITTEISSVRFAPVIQPQGVARSNADLAEDFLELIFELESGETLPGLLRYEDPIRIHVRSAALAPYQQDLDALLERLRREARLDIAETRDPSLAQIHIEAVPAAQIARVYPTAACFIVPGETSWAGFLRRPAEERLRWSDQRRLEGAAIFLPVDTTPQDARDCLHEEITQALGPANDLYRLPDSIWNDDNFHGIATPFDMLMLRTLYQPEFRSGMSRTDAAAVLPRVLDRVNPRGRGLPRKPRHPESRAWANAIETALARGYQPQERLGAAQVAAEIAVEMRPVDHRLDVSLLTLGRLTIRRDPATAARHFAEAYNLSRRRFGDGDVRTAQAGVHVAALAVSTGQPEVALTIAGRHLDAARRAQNAILVAGLLSIQAEALLELGREGEARSTRLDSLRWARYGFGDADGAFAREQAQIDALLRLDEE
jgi:hypothetical protein